MPAPDYAALNANPVALLTWLDSNMMMVGLLKNTEYGFNGDWVTLSPDPKTTATKASGGAVDPFYLKNLRDGTGSNATALKAYICNYVAKEAHSVLLSDQANFCFTTTMNGCTFGIGRPGADGSVLVTHANTGGNTGAQQDQIFGAHGTNEMAMLEPALYRNLAPGRSLHIATFGIRGAGGWKFHFQLYEKTGGYGRVFSLLGTYPVPVQQFSPEFALPR